MPSAPSQNKMRRVVHTFLEGGYYAPTPTSFVWTNRANYFTGYARHTPGTSLFVMNGAPVLYRGVHDEPDDDDAAPGVWTLGSFYTKPMPVDTFIFISPVFTRRHDAAFLLGVLRLLTRTPFTIRRFPVPGETLHYAVTLPEYNYMPGTPIACRMNLVAGQDTRPQGDDDE